MSLGEVILVKFGSQYEAAATFMRIQEHYESPNREFRTRAFTREEYEDWYVKVKGSFSYYEDWAGFNVPSPVIARFREECWRPRTLREQALLDLLPATRPGTPCYYVIGTDDDSVIGHELAHAMFFLCPDYAAAVRAVIETANVGYWVALRQMGYDDTTIPDEINAYVLTGLCEELEGLPDTIALRERLRDLSAEYLGFDLSAESEAELRARVRTIEFPHPRYR